MLTATQSAALKADIASIPLLAGQPFNSDGDFFIAEWYNATAVPNFVVYRGTIPIESVGNAIALSEISALSVADSQRLQLGLALNPGGFDLARQDHRDFLGTIFSQAQGPETRARLLALWRKPATNAEKLFATGTGLAGDPAVLGFTGRILHQDIREARNLP